MKEIFTVKHALLCEDIREEKTGKHTLVGVYPGDIEISAIPGNMSVALYVEMTVHSGGTNEIALRFSGPGEHMALLKAVFTVSDKMKFAILATPRIDLLIDKEGKFLIEMSTDEKKWSKLIEKQITLNSSLAAISTSPLPESEAPKN